jgi:hypothetical protein
MKGPTDNQEREPPELWTSLLTARESGHRAGEVSNQPLFWI